jgi:predicted restriction endonuclease
MIAVNAARRAFPCRRKDSQFGKAEVLSVIAVDPENPTFQEARRALLLWNHLCRKRVHVHLDTRCLKCGTELRWNHGAHHYSHMVVSALSVLELKDAVLKADWKGFGAQTAKDFLALCDHLTHRLCLD